MFAAVIVVGDKRSDHRARLFIAAELWVSGTSFVVMIRNLSVSGALIELERPPTVGTEVEIRRGSHVVVATVAWSTSKACGLKFSTPIALDAWITSSTVGRSHGGEADLETHPSSSPDMGAVVVDADVRERLASELGFIARMIEGLGEELANDPYVLSRYGKSLQTFDIAVQILGHLANVARADDPDSAIQGIGMDELRRRLRPKQL